MKKALLAMLLCSAAFAQTKSTAAKKAPAAKPDLLKPSSWTAHAPAVYRAKFTTTKGPVIIEVTRAWAPLGADRFYNLVRSGFFTDAPFFRVMTGFMAQFGLSARPDVNRAWERASFMDDKGIESNQRGTVTFASTGRPGSRGTQLFINYKDNSFLDASGFVPIGKVVEGMEVVDQFYSGYGDTSTKEDEIGNGGKAYLDRYMPKVDKILTAAIVPLPPATPPAPKPDPAAKQ